MRALNAEEKKMSFQDDKFAFIDKVKFKYGALKDLVIRYDSLVKLPQPLQEEFLAYGGKGGLWSCERFWSVLKREYSQISAPPELEVEIAKIVNYDDFRAEQKWDEFQRLREKTIIVLPPQLEEIVRACEERQSNSNLYEFEKRLNKYWFNVNIQEMFRDELRLITRLGSI